MLFYLGILLRTLVSQIFILFCFYLCILVVKCTENIHSFHVSSNAKFIDANTYVNYVKVYLVPLFIQHILQLPSTFTSVLSSRPPYSFPATPFQDVLSSSSCLSASLPTQTHTSCTPPFPSHFPYRHIHLPLPSQHHLAYPTPLSLFIFIPITSFPSPPYLPTTPTSAAYCLHRGWPRFSASSLACPYPLLLGDLQRAFPHARLVCLLLSRAPP